MPAPRATYRVQLNAGFTFDDAAALAGYLADLGVSHLYCSPYLQAAPGSTHGYDVVDHARLNRELGGEEAFDRLCRALADAGLNQVLDIVPNHMAVSGRQNAWWWDVLENGPSSRYAAYFDIDWNPPEEKLRQVVLMPILGDHYGRVLERGELRLAREGATFTIRYFDHAVPVSPRSLDGLLAAAAERVGSDELASVAVALGRLPHATDTDRASVDERHRDKEVLRATLDRLLDEQPAVAEAVDAVVAETNADPDALDAVVERQNYRLAYWRVAGQELDYRRFFDIPTLVGLRTERPDVFADAHELVLRLVRDGRVEGLRVDHPDGLRDPTGYVRRLHEATGGAWVVAEKILEAHEELPPEWPVAGTTGYDFLNVAGGLFVDPDGEAALSEVYAEFAACEADYPSVVYESKHLVMREVLAADVNRLVNLMVAVCERHRRHRDHSRRDLNTALREVIAGFSVYRTYVRPGQPPSAADEEQIAAALRSAGERRPDVDADLLAFVGELLLLRHPGRVEEDFTLRFQQATGPVMAKGVEDTAFYRFNRLVSLNEVGGDPGRFGATVEEFHGHNRRIAADWPSTLLATSTHDTKRSEDVRARIALLSEIPDEWAAAVRRWSAMNDRHRTDGMPDANAEYLLYQVLVGAHPLDADRAAAYMEKASKEAKHHTSWIGPAPAYDQALKAFVAGVVDDAGFAADLAAFAEPLIAPGRVTSLAQALLKLTAPGVPDLYQGSELWDLSLVDPDNRRPVDYDARRRLLEKVRHCSIEELGEWDDDGAPKLFTVLRALELRRRRAEAFAPGASYEPVATTGAQARRVVAYVRGATVAVVVPRLVIGLRGGWGDTVVELPPGRWVSAFHGRAIEGGRTVPVAGVLEHFPVALLSRER
jgi:(1->4)-alpha-D-glucan 1-alpha-D-glucosylmutase